MDGRHLRQSNRVDALLPTDAQLWAWRNHWHPKQYATVICATPRAVTEGLMRRGWTTARDTTRQHRTYLSMAPCQECGAPASVPVTETRRMCEACRPQQVRPWWWDDFVEAASKRGIAVTEVA